MAGKALIGAIGSEECLVNGSVAIPEVVLLVNLSVCLSTKRSSPQENGFQ